MFDVYFADIQKIIICIFKMCIPEYIRYKFHYIKKIDFTLCAERIKIYSFISGSFLTNTFHTLFRDILFYVYVLFQALYITMLLS